MFVRLNYDFNLDFRCGANWLQTGPNLYQIETIVKKMAGFLYKGGRLFFLQDKFYTTLHWEFICKLIIFLGRV
jgi:hypothetical protein